MSSSPFEQSPGLSGKDRHSAVLNFMYVYSSTFDPGFTQIYLNNLTSLSLISYQPDTLINNLKLNYYKISLCLYFVVIRILLFVFHFLPSHSFIYYLLFINQSIHLPSFKLSLFMTRYFCWDLDFHFFYFFNIFKGDRHNFSKSYYIKNFEFYYV